MLVFVFLRSHPKTTQTAPSFSVNIQDIRMTGRYFFSIILLICVATTAAQYNCSYELITKTGIQKSANATSGAVVNLVFYNFTSHVSFPVNNLSHYGILGPQYEYFQNNTLDVFFFDGPCARICQTDLTLYTSQTNYWNLTFFRLRASLTHDCNYFLQFNVGRVLNATNPDYPFDFCTGELTTRKHKKTAASLLRLGRMPY